ncbi:MAG TPA: pyridoxamine 5'-phosphate oxidase family protein [Myxococcota bacterium]|nr:pyridoxamine 5'-phosphate oxidase family protein [Myxococcota bacterium]
MRPDDPIVRGFLRDSFVARVATQSRSGRPSLTPLWFIVDRGHLYMATGQATLAARNAVANPEVAILLDGEAAGRSECVLRVHGKATVHSGFPTWRVLARLALKYYVAPPAARAELAHAAQWRLRTRYYAQGQSAVIEVAPETAELVRSTS